MTSIEKVIEVLGEKIEAQDIEIALLKYDKEKLQRENADLIKAVEELKKALCKELAKEGSQI